MNYQKRDDLAKDIYKSLVNQTYNHSQKVPDNVRHFEELTKYAKQAATVFFQDNKKPDKK